MIVTVRFESSLRDLAGMRSLEVELPEPSSLQDLLVELEERFGKGILGQSSEYSWRHASSHVLMLKNGEAARAGEASGDLADGDTITLLPPLAGGSRGLVDPVIVQPTLVIPPCHSGAGRNPESGH